MRRALAGICLLFALIPAGASAHSYVGGPITHGPDPKGVAAGGKAKAPRAVARRLPSSWCGPQLGGDDRASETDNGGFKYHAVYMVPADAPDRFGPLAGTIQNDAFGASALIENLYGRAIRFDMGTACGPQYLDITVVRMPHTSAQLQSAAGAGTGTFDLVTNALDGAGLRTIQPNDSYSQAATLSRNYVVWLDGPAPAGTCGQASIYDDPRRETDNLNNYGGKVAVVFPSGAGGFCSPNAVRHEIGHNLGALQQPAPNAFDGAHCADAIEDTMCYSNAPQVANGQRGLFFDYRNDDYWDPASGPALPWWTVNLNRFLCPTADCNVAPGAVDTPDAAADGDGDGVTDADDNCPQVANADQSDRYGDDRGDACEKRAAAGRVKLRAKRGRDGWWRLSLRATGSGRAVVTVRCRVRRRGQVRTVLSRSTRLPRTLHGKVRCRAGRPRAQLFVKSAA